MDFIRRPYTTKVRPWKDSDDTVDLVWYPCLPTAPVLGFPSKIQSLDWSAEPWEATGVGEVFGEPRTFNRKRPIPAATGAHVCGTEEQFAEGEEYDPEGPVVEYRADGLPTCCFPGGGPPVREPGGIGGMAAITNYVPGPIGAEAYLVNLISGTGGTCYRTGPRSWHWPFGLDLVADGGGTWRLFIRPPQLIPGDYITYGWDGWTIGWEAWFPLPGSTPQLIGTAPTPV